MDRPVRRARSAPPPERPVRRARARTDPPKPPVTSDRTCPQCESENSEFLGCVGTLPGYDGATEALLILTRICRECGVRWSTQRIRTDVCAHGRSLKVPCADCPRSWADIEAKL